MDDIKNQRIIKVPCGGLKKYELNSMEREASKLFVPFRRESDMLHFDVTYLVSVCDFLGKNPSVIQYVKVLEELRNALVCAEEYLFDMANLCLDPDTVFWNDATERICFLYAGSHSEEAEDEMDRFRIWSISLWHRSVSLDWLNDELILALHLTAVCLFKENDLVSALSAFLDRMSSKLSVGRDKEPEPEKETLPSEEKRIGLAKIFGRSIKTKR